jgi:membrane peptidoglycan carboxypeptidase
MTSAWQRAEAPTVPLRLLPYAGPEDRVRRGLTEPGATERGTTAPGAVVPRRRRFRWIKRLCATVMALVALGVIAVNGLLVLLPGVGDAPALVRAIDRAHHSAYPGPALPPRFAAALVATEDHRFYAEPGIDPVAAGRALLGRLGAAPDQGGATLDQQLAKMLYVSGRRGALPEAEQVLLGVKLDLSYSKAEILLLYADAAYFGHGYYGLAAASCGYFAERPARLSWGQAAMLAGLVRAPFADDPLSRFANARARQAHVLVRLIDTGKLTRQQASQAYRMPLHLARGRPGRC